MREKTTRYQAGTLRRSAAKETAKGGEGGKAAGVSAENTVHHQQISRLGRVLRECRCDLSESLSLSLPSSFVCSFLPPLLTRPIFPPFSFSRLLPAVSVFRPRRHPTVLSARHGSSTRGSVQCGTKYCVE